VIQSSDFPPASVKSGTVFKNIYTLLTLQCMCVYD